MIYYYTGVPGSGKSYHMAVDIYKYLASGKNVISNFNVNDFQVKTKRNKDSGHFIYVPNEEWLENHYRSIGGKNKNLKEYSYINGLINYARNFHKSHIVNGEIAYFEHQTLLVFDECHVIWNSRAWNKADRMAWLEFFGEHRKFGFDMILISQSDGNVDKQIRERLENEVFHRKFFNFVKPKILGDLLRSICGAELFIVIERKYGMKSKDAHYRTYYIWGKKKYYDFYNTSAFFSFKLDPDFQGALASPSPSRDTLWRETLEELGYIWPE